MKNRGLHSEAKVRVSGCQKIKNKSQVNEGKKRFSWPYFHFGFSLFCGSLAFSAINARNQMYIK